METWRCSTSAGREVVNQSQRLRKGLVQKVSTVGLLYRVCVYGVLPGEGMLKRRFDWYIMMATVDFSKGRVLLKSPIRDWDLTGVSFFY